MNFRYFKGPVEDMGDLLTGRKTCSICGKQYDFCFSLEFSITNKFPSKEKEGKIGCYDCLKKGAFGFWHNTELGFVDENGLRNSLTKKSYNPPIISDEILSELRHTPQVIMYQDENWLAHCNDFMVYNGTWTPPDFYKNSPNGDGRLLFLEMTDAELNHLWDESLPDGKTILEEWYPTYYVFQCRHCNKLRGYWDCN